jgi:DNA polymerase elongation subunit (family B)
MTIGTCFTYSWSVNTDDEERGKESDDTVIKIYGITEDDKTVCLIVRDFKPYVYIEVPPQTNQNNWMCISEYIAEKLKIAEDEYEAEYITNMKGLYYNNNTYNKYIKLSLPTKHKITYLSFLLRNPVDFIKDYGSKVSLKIHEVTATPILQLTREQNISCSQWITFKGKEERFKLTSCQYEYTVSYKDIHSHNTNKVANPLVMAFDIEVNSHRPLVMPDASEPKDKVFQIACVVWRHGTQQKDVQKHLLTFGNPDQGMVGVDVCIHKFNTEYELLLGYSSLIKKIDPNIIIGYNIFTFDIPYMIERSKMTRSFDGFRTQGFDKCASKIKDIKWSSTAFKNQSYRFINAEGRLFIDMLPLIRRNYTNFSSYTLKYVSTHFLGSTKDPLDPQGIFRCYRIGMKVYDDNKIDLDKKRKKILESKDQEQLVKFDSNYKKMCGNSSKAFAIVGKYNVQDSMLCVQLFMKLKTWIDISEMANVVKIPIFDVFARGMLLRVYSQVYHECKNVYVIDSENYVYDKNDHVHGAKVINPIPGIYDRVMPFDFNSLYPTSIIAYNLDFTTLIRDEDLHKYNKNDYETFEWEDHVACSHDPLIIKRDEINLKIVEVDKQLKKYRTNRDECKGKYMKNERDKHVKLINELNEIRKKYVLERSKVFKSKPKFTICAKRKFSFVKGEKQKGVLPNILEKLLNSRKQVKKELEILKKKLNNSHELKDHEIQELQILCDTYDMRQNSYKLSANSAYGSMGAVKGYLPFMAGAHCTTYLGRKNITVAADSIQNKWNGTLVYGDTDSAYVSFKHLQGASECWDYANKVSIEVSKLFPSPMKLAFEDKLYWKFMIFSKKRYMCLKCEKNGTILPNIDKKGVLLARRDNCKFVRRLYEGVIVKIFNGVNIKEIMEWLLDEFNMMFSNSIVVNEFMISKTVGAVGDLKPVYSKDENGKDVWKIGQYKIRKDKILPSDEKGRDELFKKKDCDNERDYYISFLPAQVQLAQKMRDKRGQIVDVNTRLEYVLTDIGYKSNQSEKIESYEYYMKHKDVIKLNYIDYFNQLMRPLDQIFEVLYGPDEQSFLKKQLQLRQIKIELMSDIRKLLKPKIVFK